jgi:hypothetical protein
MKEKTRQDAMIERVADIAMRPGGQHLANHGVVRRRHRTGNNDRAQACATAG